MRGDGPHVPLRVVMNLKGTLAAQPKLEVERCLGLQSKLSTNGRRANALLHAAKKLEGEKEAEDKLEEPADLERGAQPTTPTQAASHHSSERQS